MEPGFSDEVALVKSYPNADPGIIDYYARKGVKGIVLEGTGLGHVPLDWHPFIRKYKDSIFFVQVSQCLYGRTNILVYSGLRMLSDAGVICGEDMLPETVYVKLA